MKYLWRAVSKETRPSAVLVTVLVEPVLAAEGLAAVWALQVRSLLPAGRQTLLTRIPNGNNDCIVDEFLEVHSLLWSGDL